MLNTVWGDLGPGLPADFATAPAYYLTDDLGRSVLLDLPLEVTRKGGGPLKFNRHRVRISGVPGPHTNQLIVTSIRLEDIIPLGNSHIMGAHVTGPQKWVTILCRFADSPAVTPEPMSFFTDLMTFMDGYWQELSYGTINLAGSVVVGWVNLPGNRADYLDDPATHFAGHTLDFTDIAEDATAAVDALVNFPDFQGINLMFNQDLDCCSWGGSVTLTRDGVTKTYSATWMATWGWGNHNVVGQEMGHGFGLPHSSGPYTATYDSQWDVMSAGSTCSPPHPDIGCLGVHTIAVHKDALGWVPAARRYVASAAADQVVLLERLGNPGPAGFLVAEIPISGSSTKFYSVECRKFAGFDDQIPAEAVLIHTVDTTLGDRVAQVVDVDAVSNTNPNDAGAQWLPGEVFTDAANSIRIAVLSETDSGCLIIINPSNLAPLANAGPDQFVECASPAGTLVSLNASGSSDPDGDPLTFAWSAPGIAFNNPASPTPAATFPLGTTTVTLTVSDGTVSDSDTVQITVVDTRPPNITCPANIVQANDPGQCDAVVSFQTAGVDVCDGPVAVTCNPPSGSVFPKGTTPVNCSATDATGNSAQCGFRVTVVDKEPPRVACRPGTNPSGKKIPPAGTNARSGQNPDGFYQLLARDNCDPRPRIFVKDSASSFVAGPFNDGDNVKIVQAPGGRPRQKPAPGVIAAHITLRGEALVYGVDADGNVSAAITCKLPPPPK